MSNYRRSLKSKREHLKRIIDTLTAQEVHTVWRFVRYLRQMRISRMSEKRYIAANIRMIVKYRKRIDSTTDKKRVNRINRHKQLMFGETRWMRKRN
jgi:hypothetical protein